MFQKLHLSTLPLQVPIVQRMSLGLRRDLPEKRDIDRAHLRMRETGIFSRMVRAELMPEVPDCKERNSGVNCAHRWA